MRQMLDSLQTLDEKSRRQSTFKDGSKLLSQFKKIVATKQAREGPQQENLTSILINDSLIDHLNESMPQQTQLSRPSAKISMSSRMQTEQYDASSRFMMCSRPSTKRGTKKAVTKSIRNLSEVNSSAYMRRSLASGDDCPLFKQKQVGIVDLIEFKLETKKMEEKNKRKSAVTLPKTFPDQLKRIYYCTPFGRILGSLSFEAVHLSSFQSKRPDKPEPKVVLLFQPSLNHTGNLEIY